jgi:soluble lytic murein transglycosylase
LDPAALSAAIGRRARERAPARSWAIRVAAALSLAASSLAMASCQEPGAFGMGPAELRGTLSAGDPAPILRLDERALGDPGGYGPAGCLSLALWLEPRAAPGPNALAQAATADAAEAAPGSARADPSSMSLRLYRLAFERGSGIVKKKAGEALARRLEASADYAGLLDLTDELGGARSVDWKVRRTRLAALDALGRFDEALDEVAGIRAAFPRESAADADALACIEAAARMRKNPSAGAARSLPGLRAILLARPSSEWTARALALASAGAGAAPALTEDEARVARMRIAVRGRDYAQAYKEASAAPRELLSSSPAPLADAGKAYLYSGMSAEGASLFRAVEEAARARGAADAAWTALFYRGRFARALERWAEASSLFGRAAASAGAAGVSAADVEAARWYAAEASWKSGKTRAAGLDALVAASKDWADPEEFSDLADELFREAMRARDWELVERMSAELCPSLAPAPGARIAYTAARSLELGLSKPGGGETARDRLAAIARDEAAPPYYRALASWRSGEAAALAPPEAEAAPGAADQKAEPGELESYILGLADFGLGGAASAEARSAAAELESAALRRISARLAESGSYDASIQVAAALVAKKGYKPDRGDYRLLYPRPYLKEIRGLAADARVSERLALGLVRSESAFMAGVRSRAGAIGLTQLMPATAAEQAKAMGLDRYDLESPQDNLRIGIAHFARLLERTGSPLRAMMAYNAGTTRLNSWASAGAGLPDDLLVETLTIEETRQYCRNILQAAAAYGELYEGVAPGATAGRMAGGK